jgi:molybdenum cofactor biosynthesis enzyme MoaA
MKVAPKKYDAWLQWIVNDKCNFSCGYCVAGNSWKYNEYMKLDSDKILNTLARTGKTYLIRFSGGGEPFLVSNLDSVCLELAKRHYLGFNTNLIPKPVERLFSTLDPSRVVQVNASVHFAELERQELFGRFIRHGRLLLERGVPVTFAGIAFPEYRDRFTDWLKMFEDNGIFVRLDPYIGEYGGRRYPESYDADDLTFFKLTESRVASHITPIGT